VEKGSTKTPSIKGMALQSVTEDVQRLLAAKRITQADLEKRLAPDDLRHLEEPTVPGLWYPISLYAGLLELLRDVEGGGRDEYLVERGVRAAERLMQVGAYRHFLQSAARWGERAGEAMIQLASAFYDFTQWTLTHEAASDAYALDVTGAREFPDAARLSAQGFVQVLFARMGGRPVRVTSRRAGPDRLRYEISQQG
jgi:hypothetical protein